MPSLMERAWTVIVVTGVVTFAVRASFILLVTRVSSIPRSVGIALRMVPVAALSALVTPAVFRPEAAFAPFNPRVLAAAAVILIGVKTRSVLLATAVGLAIVTLAELALR